MGALAAALVAAPMSASAETREYILIADRQPMDAPTKVCDLTWGPRNLNSIEFDDTGLVSLAGNRFVLPEGTYELHARDPAGSGVLHRTRLQSFPDDLTILLGEQVNTGSAVLLGKFSISELTSFEFQNRCSSAVVNGMISSDLDDNILGTVQLYRVSPAAQRIAGLSEWMLTLLCVFLLVSTLLRQPQRRSYPETWS